MGKSRRKTMELVTAYVMADKNKFFKGENIMNNLDPNKYQQSVASIPQEGESGITYLPKHDERDTKHRAGRVCSGCGGYKPTKKKGKEYLCRACISDLEVENES